MSIDLGALLDLAAPIVTSAIESSGTTVDIRRPPGDAAVTVDPDSLDIIDSSTRVVSGAAAIIIAITDQGQPIGPGQFWEATRYRVLLLPDVTGVKPGDFVKITDARDSELIDRRLRITEVIADTAGVIRALDATLIGAGA